MTTIIVTHEDNEIDEFAFDAHDRVISIGRRSTNDVCIPNLSVSGMHARITIDGNSASIEDNNSTNGSYVNGRLISRQLLNENDEIVIGKTRVVVKLSGHTGVKDTNRAISAAEQADPQMLSSISDFDDIDADESFTGGDTRRANQSPPNRSDRPLSLSEKAKLALGRQNGYEHTSPQTAPLNGATGNSSANGVAKNGIAAVNATGAATATSRATANDDVAVAEVSPISDTQARIEAAVREPAAVSVEPHPLDGLDEQLTTKSATSEMNGVGYDESASTSVKKPAGAVIEIQNGAKSGQVLPIDKPVTTLGRPGVQIAAIMRKPDGYFLMHIESDDSVEMPTLNRDSIGDEPVMLQSGDRLNVAGIDVEFMLS